MTTFFNEIKEQPKAIRETIVHNKNSELSITHNKPLLLTGMGSSLASAELLVSLLHANGIQATAIDNSELLYYYSNEYLNKFHVMVISQSGESYEAVNFSENYKGIMAITNTPNSSLDKNAKITFYTHAGKENAIASTKSFTTTSALILLLGSRMIGKDYSDELYKTADVIESQLNNAEEYMKKIGDFINPDKPLVLLGRGPSILTAEQGSLTLKETSRIFAEAMSAPQFRHGPFELIEENLQAIFFNPKGITFENNRNYVMEMADLGAKVIYVSDEPLEYKNVLSFAIPSINEFVSIIPYSLIIQLAAVVLSEKRGLIAGEAKIISKVTGKE